MTKIHGNTKREHKLAAHKNHRKTLQGVTRAKRPPTFKTEESARTYAESKKIHSFDLKRVKRNKRFQIVKTKSAPIKAETTG